MNHQKWHYYQVRVDGFYLFYVRAQSLEEARAEVASRMEKSITGISLRAVDMPTELMAMIAGGLDTTEKIARETGFTYDMLNPLLTRMTKKKLIRNDNRVWSVIDVISKMSYHTGS